MVDRRTKNAEIFRDTVQRYVTDDPSSEADYTLESEFWIDYEPYVYVINPKE